MRLISLVNYAAALTSIVPLKTFWWTTQLGLLPTTMIFVYAGTRIPLLATIAERGVVSLLDYRLLLVLVASPILTWFIRWVAHHQAFCSVT